MAIQFSTLASVRQTPSGEPLPFGTLTFYAAKTLEPVPVYDSEALNSELDNPVEADSEGVWPDIWLDPEISYRVQLHDADGVLQYDCPQYVPYEAGPFLYLDAQFRCAVPGATLTFTLDDDPVAIYADPQLQTPLQNPVQADAAGLFPAIYLEDGQYVVDPSYGDPFDFPPLEVWDNTWRWSGSTGSMGLPIGPGTFDLSFTGIVESPRTVTVVEITQNTWAYQLAGSVGSITDDTFDSAQITRIEWQRNPFTTTTLIFTIRDDHAWTAEEFASLTLDTKELFTASVTQFETQQIS